MLVFNFGHQRDWTEYNVDTGNTSPLYYESYGTQKVIFDGPNREILVAPGTTVLDIRLDVYSAWKEWVRNPDLQNAEYVQAIRGVGGDAISGTTDQFVGDIYFLTNGWKLIYDPTEVLVDGVLFSDDFATAFWLDTIPRRPTFPARVSSIVNTYTVEATASAETIAATVWNATSSTYNDVGTMGELQNEIANISLGAAATPAQIVAELDANSTTLAGITTVTANTNTIVQGINTTVLTLDSNVISINDTVNTVNANLTVVGDTVDTVNATVTAIDTDLALVASDVTNIENTVTSTSTTIDSINANVISIENILANTGSALTAEQATQLRELYEVTGLDPTKPLVVTLDARSAGANISQSIATSASQTTVTRIP